MALPARIDKRLPRKLTRPRTGDSREHLAFVRSLNCCVCAWHCNGNMGPVEAHHLLRADGLPKGMGRRNYDRWAIPLCDRHHQAKFGKDTAHGHGNDEEWLASKGIDGRALATRLWSIFNNEDPEDRYDAGLRAIDRCKRVEARP